MEYLVTLGGGWLFWRYVRPNIPWNKVMDGYAYLRSSYQNMRGYEEEEQIFLLDPLPDHRMTDAGTDTDGQELGDSQGQRCIFQIGENRLQCLSTLDSSTLLEYYKELSQAPFQSPNIDYVELHYRSEKQPIPDLHQSLKNLHILKTNSQITIQDVLAYLWHRYPDQFQDTTSSEDFCLHLSLFPEIIIDPRTSYFQDGQNQDLIRVDSESPLMLK